MRREEQAGRRPAAVQRQKTRGQQYGQRGERMKSGERHVRPYAGFRGEDLLKYHDRGIGRPNDPG